jgi:hypothetical protein
MLGRVPGDTVRLAAPVRLASGAVFGVSEQDSRAAAESRPSAARVGFSRI